MDHERNEHEQWTCRIIIRGMMSPLYRFQIHLHFSIQAAPFMYIAISRASVFLFMSAARWTYMHIFTLISIYTLWITSSSIFFVGKY